MNTKAFRRENLRELAKSVGGITKLADKLNKSQGQISHLIGNRPIKNIGKKIAAQVEAVFNKPPGWLDLNHLEIEEEVSAYTERLQKSVVCLQVPLISWEEVQQFSQNDGRYSFQTIKTMIATSSNIGPRAFALNVQDDTMESSNGISIAKNSTIIVDPDIKAGPNSFVITKVSKDRGVTLKQLITFENKHYLKPLNRRYPILEITSETIILGVVIQLVVDFT